MLSCYIIIAYFIIMMSEIMLAALILVNIANPLTLVAATADCMNSQNYTANSSYNVNLDSALTALPQNIGISGFYNVSMGQFPERVNAMALCRGDIELDPCRNCVRRAVAELGVSCPYRKRAIILSGGACIVRYSDLEIFRTLTTSPLRWIWNKMNVSNPDLFKEDLDLLLEGLRSKAVNGSFERKVAGGNTTGPDSQTIYALVQCTPDLQPKDCDDCLIYAAQQMPMHCNGRIGCQVLMPSCILRFEVNSFFNEATLQRVVEAPAPEPPASPVHKPPVLPPTRNRDNMKTLIIIVAVTAAAGTVAAVIIVAILLRRRKKQKPVKQPETMDEISTPESLQYTFSTISTATNGFSDENKLGQGGFGTVYKGILPNGQEVAVKRLSEDSRQGSLEFKNEILLLARLQHKNLVRLLGFCLEGMEKLLVYEFIPNGSLDQFIFNPINQSCVNWDRRHKIIVGIAKAVLYIHEESRLKIIHRDLKPSNVLLDKEMNPKVADFGTARLFEQEETHGSTRRIVGTYGYMPPEYAMQGNFSVKSDVFSFGVLVLEIISGQKNSSHIQCGESALDLRNFAWKCWCNGTGEDILDPVLRSSLSPIADILRCIHISLLCVQEKASDRPTMAAVVLMLSSFTMTMAVPSKPAFYLHSRYGDSSVSSERERGTLSGQRDKCVSRNNSSISELYPR